METLNYLNTLMPGAGAASTGLTTLWSTILTYWLTPLYFAAIAFFAWKFIKDNAWMKLIGFIGIAAIVGILIFAGPAFFGQNGSLTTTAKGLAKNVNMILPYFLMK